VFIAVSIAAVAIMFASMVGIIYYKGSKTPESTASIVVQADDYFVGNEVIVDGNHLPAPMRRTIALDPNPDRNLICRFNIPPGMYNVRIEFNGKLIQEKAGMLINEFQVASMQLTRPPETQPTTNPSSRKTFTD